MLNRTERGRWFDGYPKVSGRESEHVSVLIVHPLPGHFVSQEDVGTISGLLGRVTGVAMGPGLGSHPETRDA